MNEIYGIIESNSFGRLYMEFYDNRQGCIWHRAIDCSAGDRINKKGAARRWLTQLMS